MCLVERLIIKNVTISVLPDIPCHHDSHFSIPSRSRPKPFSISKKKNRFKASGREFEPNLSGERISGEQMISGLHDQPTINTH